MRLRVQRQSFSVQSLGVPFGVQGQRDPFNSWLVRYAVTCLPQSVRVRAGGLGFRVQEFRV